MKIALIADDLTGRNDCALQWFRRGFDVRLPEPATLDETLAPDGEGQAQLIAVDADSRYLSPAEAYRRVSGLIDRMKQADIAIWFKKIDSTLRGNLDTELAAFLDRLSFEWVVIHPGFPAGGRTVADGRLYVDGVLWPVEGRGCVAIAELFSPDNPGKVGHLRQPDYMDDDMLRGKLERLRREDARLLVVDATTEAELDRCVRRLRAVSDRILWVGSLGLASALAGTLPGAGGASAAAPRLDPSDKPFLFVAGSYNAKAREQIRDFLRRRPCEVVDVDPAEVETDRLIRQTERALGRGLPVIVRTIPPVEAHGARLDRKAQLRLAGVLGTIASALVRTGATERILATGGDTARAIIDRLDATSTAIVGEIEPGVPALAVRPFRNLVMVTKAGGFGSIEVFSNMVETIRRWEG